MTRFFAAASQDERRAINTFLARHNARGMGSATGYAADYAAAWPPDGQSLLEPETDLIDGAVLAAGQPEDDERQHEPFGECEVRVA